MPVPKSLRFQISDKAAASLPFAEVGQYVVRDTELTGFVLVVGRRKKTYSVHSEIWRGGRRKALKKAIGTFGEMTARDARRTAMSILGATPIQSADAEPGAEAAAQEAVEAASIGVNLREAWNRYHLGMKKKKRADGTIANYRDHVERLFADWLDKPLRDLGNDWNLAAVRHDQLTITNGPYIANAALRTLRAIYNHAWRKDRSLPAGNPALAVDWNEEQRRNTGIGPRALPGWFDELLALKHPIRREFHLFTLLSGCRPGALKRAEVNHVDFARRVLHIPAPKGGAKRAFDIPLSRTMIRCLIRSIRLSRRMHPISGQRWVFAADSLSGHLEAHKEDRQELSKFANDLRQSFRTCAQVARVPGLDIKLLMNHALPGVNEDYITVPALLEDHLRSQQEAISRVILDAVRKGAGAKMQRVLAWLGSSKINSIGGAKIFPQRALG